MSHKVFISFKTEDAAYKDAIKLLDGIDYIDKSLKVAINSDDQDYIMRRIRADYLSDSTVTIFLIGQYSNENLGADEQYFVKKELQASLSNTESHGKNGILGVVLPSMSDAVYRGSLSCASCGGTHNFVKVDDSTVISEFSYNYYIPHNRCSHSEDDRYCVLVAWEDFKANPNAWIDAAFDKRSAPIASKTRVRP